MNGAIAEPFVSTTSPPKITIMIRIGSSQNFFRTRINRQSSATKSIFVSLFRHDPFGKPALAFPGRALELVFHRLGQRSRWLPHDPIAVRVGLPLEPQNI